MLSGESLDPRAIGTLAGHLACDVGDTTTDRANDGNPTWSHDGFTLTPPVLDNSSCGRCPRAAAMRFRCSVHMNPRTADSFTTQRLSSISVSGEYPSRAAWQL